MRTLASTFGSRAEAEAAGRRLESIGIARDRIILKDVGEAGGEPGGASGAAAAGVFVSVKVTTDQVAGASEILKSSRPAGDGAGAVSSGREAASPPAPSPDVQPRVAPAAAPKPDPVPRAASQAAATPPHAPGAATIAGLSRAQLIRYFALFCVALVAAFLLGAGLGLIL
ncbi:MAG TPA: hypothetical protein VF589_09600 [Allosphingosinicella sp.]